ncbi:DoxX family protein [Hymenobacter taeanensis]|uniref:DoxX family protein n=2 Tax=Hymenobacteraceae TaxID=1853232 RepID=A0A6M6BN17_9BACT|nr:DoxX family protein [Hymenobacter taeanensis]
MAERKTRNSASNPVWMDGLRMLLGLFLFIKGISFLNNSSDVFYLLSQQESLEHLKKASLFFSVFHIIGGLMIAFGFLTRFALLIQIPILIGAVFIVNTQNGLTLQNVELWVSAAVLALMLFFMVVGPGRYSVDHKLLRQEANEL